MKKLLFLLGSLLFSVLLISCTVDDNGEFHLTWLFWFLLIGFIVIVVIGVISGNYDIKKVDQSLKEKGLNRLDFKPFGTYVGGHPRANDTLPYMYILKNGKIIDFYSGNILSTDPILKFSIDSDKIKNIQIEDATSIEKRLTVGRLLLVGVFAFAWKKKKKNELAFVVIDWNDGRFDHATTFSFEGKDAMQKANVARNNLIAFCK